MAQNCEASAFVALGDDLCPVFPRAHFQYSTKFCCVSSFLQLLILMIVTSFFNKEKEPPRVLASTKQSPKSPPKTHQRIFCVFLCIFFRRKKPIKSPERTIDGVRGEKHKESNEVPQRTHKTRDGLLWNNWGDVCLRTKY